MFAVYGDDSHSLFFCKLHDDFTARNERFFIRKRDIFPERYPFERGFKPRKTRHRHENYIRFFADGMQNGVLARVKSRTLRKLFYFAGFFAKAKAN